MKKASNNKKIFIIAIEVIVIVLTFIGVTLATSNIINDNIKINIFHGKVNTLYSIDYYFNYTQFHVFINLFL